MSEFVKVIVRCRPLNSNELENDVDVVVTMDTIDHQVVLRHKSLNVNSPRKMFTFDRVFDTNASNETIYNDVVSPLVENVLQGYNGCIFAYGQTSCGKTFSMQGAQQPQSQRGIMNRTFEQIFEYIQTTDVTYCAIRASYLELYNEEVRDLLHKNNHHKLVIKEHPEKGVYVQDLSIVDIVCIEDMEEVLEVGSWNRVFGSTAQNPDSSRSHCIFTIEYEMCFTNEEDKECFRSGRINLVDLAGSERQRYSKSHGERLREATKINLSLSALGNVISALVNEKAKHIPYRASKLTRLLQDSLGGNSHTLMIACISPGENNESETLSTLRYANRAKNIKNMPRINEDPKDALIRQYQKEIKALRQMLSSQVSLANNIFSSQTSLSNDTIITDDLPNEGISYFSDSELNHGENKLISKRSAVVISKQDRLFYEQKIASLKRKYSLEQLSRGRTENTLRVLKIEYDNYRLKNEYKIQKLQQRYKVKIKKLLEKSDEVSIESAYISASGTASENLSHDSMSDKQEKSTLLSPSRENPQLWSSQWLRGYCDTGKRNMSNKGFYSPSQDYELDCHCICNEMVKENAGEDNERSTQTCDTCIRRSFYAQFQSSVVTKQPDTKQSLNGGYQVDENATNNIKKAQKKHSGLCCLLPFISFFGEQITVT